MAFSSVSMVCSLLLLCKDPTLNSAALAGAPLGSGRGDGIQLSQRGLLLTAAAQLPPPAARAARCYRRLRKVLNVKSSGAW